MMSSNYTRIIRNDHGIKVETSTSFCKERKHAWRLNAYIKEYIKIYGKKYIKENTA